MTKRGHDPSLGFVLGKWVRFGRWLSTPTVASFWENQTLDLILGFVLGK
jgi:hypothetical protein